MITVLSAIFVLGALIFFHELGHFLMAKWAGIQVDRFSLGFPPSILSKRFGETEYCIGLIPLGGYVKMAGENPDETATGAPHEFMSKPVRVRAMVILAGPVMNLLLAWLILWGWFLVNGQVVIDPRRAIIGSVVSGSPAEAAGLQAGDVVTSIDNIAIGPYSDLSRVVSKAVGKPIPLVWERNGQTMSATVTTKVEDSYTDRGEKIKIGVLGVYSKVEHQPVGFFEGAGLGMVETLGIVKKIGVFLWELITLRVSAKMIGGPVFITQAVGQMAQIGFSALLFFMAFLSVNLGIVNIIPIPVLDGGHLLFLAIEKIKGSPLTINQRMIAQQVGMVFLLLVIVMVTYNDIVRFISG